MQRLHFEEKWDRAISAKDRNYIEKLFSETKNTSKVDVVFTPVREAINHQKALLVTVLIHNFRNETVKFENAKMVYLVDNEAFAERNFSVPTIEIPEKSSMPWTFIFPKESYKSQMNYKNGRLEAR